jgi:hypothetical protein
MNVSMYCLYVTHRVRSKKNQGEIIKLKKQNTSRKDILVVGFVYLGLLSLVAMLPENNPLISGVVLAIYALVSYVAVDRIT